MNCLFFCTSTGHIIPTLKLIQIHNPKKIIIVTYLEPVKKFFQTFKNRNKYIEKIIFIQAKEIRDLSPNPFFIFSRFFYKYLLFRKYFQNIKNFRIFFFSTYMIYTVFFIKKLLEQNTIFYYKTDYYQYDIDSSNQKCFEKIRSLLIKIVYGLSYRYIYGPVKKYALYNGKLIRSVHVIEYKELYNFPLDSSRILPITMLQGKKIIIMAANVPHTVLSENLEKGWKNIIEVLKKYYSLDQIILKNHPRNRFENFIPFQNITEIPSFIPSEIFYDYKVDFIITFYSSTLKNLPMNTVPKIICTLNLFEYRSSKEFEMFQDTFSNISNDKLFLPIDINEFETIIRENA